MCTYVLVENQIFKCQKGSWPNYIIYQTIKICRNRSFLLERLFIFCHSEQISRKYKYTQSHTLKYKKGYIATRFPSTSSKYSLDLLSIGRWWKRQIGSLHLLANQGNFSLLGGEAYICHQSWGLIKLYISCDQWKYFYIWEIGWLSNLISKLLGFLILFSVKEWIENLLRCCFKLEALGFLFLR